MRKSSDATAPGAGQQQRPENQWIKSGCRVDLEGVSRSLRLGGAALAGALRVRAGLWPVKTCPHTALDTSTGPSPGPSGSPSTGASQSDRRQAAQTPMPVRLAGFRVCRHLYAHLNVSHLARYSCRGPLPRALRSRRNRYRLRAGYATLLLDTARTCVERQLALSTFVTRCSVVVEERLSETRSRQARTGASASHRQQPSRPTLAARCSVVVDGRKQCRGQTGERASGTCQLGAAGGEVRKPGPWGAVNVCLHRLGGWPW